MGPKEALNKELGSQLSAAVHEAAPVAMRDALSLGQLPIRGYADPIAVWRLA